MTDEQAAGVTEDLEGLVRHVDGQIGRLERWDRRQRRRRWVTVLAFVVLMAASTVGLYLASSFPAKLADATRQNVEQSCRAGDELRAALRRVIVTFESRSGPDARPVFEQAKRALRDRDCSRAAQKIPTQ